MEQKEARYIISGLDPVQLFSIPHLSIQETWKTHYSARCSAEIVSTCKRIRRTELTALLEWTTLSEANWMFHFSPISVHILHRLIKPTVWREPRMILNVSSADPWIIRHPNNLFEISIPTSCSRFYLLDSNNSPRIGLWGLIGWIVWNFVFSCVTQKLAEWFLVTEKIVLNSKF